MRTQREETAIIFNYRLSRSRRIVESTFGILSTRFRVLHQPISLHPKNVVKVVKAIVVLHNFLQEETLVNSASLNMATMNLPRKTDGEQYTAFDQREDLADYFMNSGAVPFQWKQLSI